ncbi:MAG: hypothetical protein AAF518_22815 [Spirochaetota bacterium]
MNRIKLKDACLLAIPIVITFLTLPFLLQQMNFTAKLWFLSNSLFIFSLSFILNRSGMTLFQDSSQIKLYTICIFFFCILVEIFRSQVFHSIDTNAHFSKTGIYLFSLGYLLLYAIWVTKFLPRKKVIGTTAFLLVFLGLLIPLGSIFLKVLGSIPLLNQKADTEIGAIAGVVLGTMTGLFLGELTNEDESGASAFGVSVFGSMLGAVVGVMCGGIIMVISRWTGFPTVLATLSSLGLGYKAQREIQTNENSLKTKLYYFAITSVVLATILYYFTFSQVISIYHIVLFGGLFTSISQIYLMSSIRYRRARKKRFPSAYNLFFTILSALAVYAFINYILQEKITLSNITSLYLSFALNLVLLDIFARVYLFFYRASAQEKQELDMSKTMLCQKHYLRVVPQIETFPYAIYECPIPDCGKKHIIHGVKNLVGCIIGANNLPNWQQDSLYLSLWNQQSKQAKYAEIDRLEIHYIAGFSEEDYNQAIQSVVGKIYNSMEPKKRKQVRVEIQAKVPLSEGSKRLLQNVFESFK